jgi:hypothetical protein
MENPFTAHPQAVGETYLQHSVFAGSVGLRMIAGGLACLVHGVLPFLFATTGSRIILALADRIAAGRRKADRSGILAELAATRGDD